MDYYQEPVDLEVFENNDAEIVLGVSKEFTDGSGEAPYDLTGAVLHLYVKKKRTDLNDDAVLHYEGPPRIEVPDPPAGKVVMNFLAADLSEPGWYHYNLDAVQDGKRRTVGHGRLVVRNL